MPKVQSKTILKLRQYVREYPLEFQEIDSKLFCVLCNYSVDYLRTNGVESHLQSKCHISRIASGSKITTRRTHHSSCDSEEIEQRTRLAFRAANIPDEKLNHPQIRDLFQSLNRRPSYGLSSAIRTNNMAQPATVVTGPNIVLQQQPAQQQQVQLQNPVLWEGRVSIPTIHQERDPLHIRIMPLANDPTSLQQAQALNFSLWSETVNLIILKSDCKALIHEHLTRNKSKGNNSITRVSVEMGRREDNEFMRNIFSVPQASAGGQAQGPTNFGLIHMSTGRATADRGILVVALLIMYYIKRDIFIGIVLPDQQKFIADINAYLRRGQPNQITAPPGPQMMPTASGAAYTTRPAAYQQPQVMMQAPGPSYQQAGQPQPQQATRQVVISQQPGQQHIIRQQYTPVAAQQQQQPQQQHQQPLRTVPIPGARYHQVMQVTGGAPQVQTRFTGFYQQQPDQQPNPNDFNQSHQSQY